MISHNADPVMPEVYDILQYIRQLFTVCISPQTVRNRISGAKTWVQEMGGDLIPFSDRAISQTIRGGSKAAAHIPSRAPALTPDMVKYTAAYLLKAGRAGVAPRAALLIGYFTMIRQSNLLSPSTRTWGGPHTIRRRDIRIVPGGLRVDITSSKTICANSEATSLFVPKIGSRCCPVLAWESARDLKAGHPDDPAFITSAGVPLTPHALTRLVRSALTEMGVATPQRFTLHGLRRGAAQECQRLNVDTKHIMSQGTWKSGAIRTYTIQPASTEAPIALATRFG